ncbi:DinB family protein [Hyphobacterium sp. HN65]|uniref:DinB family protein n=1 Tax=Hyphobacterium lacteum TaxID=3116575 RepID=A0ABU7LNW9_9PROT|nr:DinB family protein [Hyphobacterium sp. HN65]MEE2525620.1 DinB family protein [Hyphobacterium sp. HN65]
MREHFERLGAYNAWANERLYSMVAELPAERVDADVGAYFGSIFGTLSHLLVADRIWMFRLTGEGPVTNDLRERPCDDLTVLWKERQSMDQRIIAMLASLDEDALAEMVHYRNTRGEPHALPRHFILTHLFNHQTHHRGQVHHMLSAEGEDPPPLDLLYFVLPAA